MDISDEMLNAFIDGELSSLEMSIVRDAIATNERVALRVEALAAINSQVHARLHQIDSISLSPNLENLRQQLEASARDEQTDNVVSFPWWHSSRLGGVWQSAAAASVAAVFVFVIGLGINSGSSVNALPEWAVINQALSTQPSGQIMTTDSGAAFEARLSFQNQAGEYCRQFYLKPVESTALQSIACRTGDDWVLRAAMPTGDQSNFQTASHDRALDQVIDSMIKGDVISPEQEKTVIQQDWKP